MKQLLTTLLATGALALGTQVAEATQITGTVQMSGAVTLDNTNLGDANSATFSNLGQVVAGSGSYASVPYGTPVAWNSFSWDPDTTPIIPLWSFAVNPDGIPANGDEINYSFDLQSFTDVDQAADHLTVKGLGFVNATGFDQTPANWEFRITDTSGGGATYSFGFSSSNTALPDGGATAMLLGAGFLGLAGLRRKLS